MSDSSFSITSLGAMLWGVLQSLQVGSALTFLLGRHLQALLAPVTSLRSKSRPGLSIWAPHCLLPSVLMGPRPRSPAHRWTWHQAYVLAPPLVLSFTK